MELTIISTLVGIFASWFIAKYYFTRKKKWTEKIAELEAHSEYIGKLRKSSVELNRRAFTTLFLVLFLLSFAQLIPVLIEYFSAAIEYKGLSKLVIPLKLLFHMATCFLAYMEFRIFSDVVNYKKAIDRIEKKIDKINKKIGAV